MKILLIVLAVIILYILITYNMLARKKIRVQQAKSGIDIYLKQRFDLIPNLVECIKQYCKYEKETLTQIAKLRTQYIQNKDLETGAQLNNQMNSLIAVAENYPELKANEQFSTLEKSLVKIESQLQAARRLYNGEVTALNILGKSIYEMTCDDVEYYKNKIIAEKTYILDYKNNYKIKEEDVTYLSDSKLYKQFIEFCKNY